MDNSTKTALAAAVATGYVLGRTKKGKLAFALATYAAGRRFSLNPQQLLNQSLHKIADTPQFAQLNEQLRGELMQPGRAAVSAVTDRGLHTLAGTLHERTAALREGKPAKERVMPEEGVEEIPEEEIEEEVPPEPPGPPAAKKAAKKAVPSEAPAVKEAAKKTAAKKAAPKKAAAKKTAAKKTTSKSPAAKKSSARTGGRR